MSRLRTHDVDKRNIKEYRCTICDFKTRSERKAKKHQFGKGHFVDTVLVHECLNRKV